MRPNQRMAKERSGLAVHLVQADRPLPRRGVGLVAFNRIPRILTSIFISDPSATYLLSQCMLQSRVLEPERRGGLAEKDPQKDKDGDCKARHQKGGKRGRQVQEPLLRVLMGGAGAVEPSAGLSEWTAAAQCGPACRIHCSYGTPRCGGPAPIHTGSPGSLGTGRPPT